MRTIVAALAVALMAAAVPATAADDSIRRTLAAQEAANAPHDGAAAPTAGEAAPATILTVEEYRDGVAEIAAAATRDDAETVRRVATRLLDARIASGDGSVQADSTILGPLTHVSEPAAARQRLPALRALQRSLGSESSGAAPDPALLARLAEEQRVAAPPGGGEALALDTPTLTLGERARRWIRDFLGGIAELLGDLVKWLLGLLPRRGEGRTGLGPMFVVVGSFVLLLLAAGLLLALRALREKKGPVPATPSLAAEASLETDKDPLSRSVSGWEVRARELAAAGRLREALRAWYHAVLVTLHAEGALHYRKGRTNWDYLATLAPSLAWRPLFAELTAEFDREWYGLNATTADALARFEAGAQQVMQDARSGRRSAA